jgi:hypothetical protein
MVYFAIEQVEKIINSDRKKPRPRAKLWHGKTAAAAAIKF